MMESVALKTILEKAWSGTPLTRSNLRYLLSLDEHSTFSTYVRQTASMLTRLWTENSAAIVGSIGIEQAPCSGGCKFCSFGAGHATCTPYQMTEEELGEKIQEFCRYNDLYALVLVTMHQYHRDYLLRMVRHARAIAPREIQIRVNIGDSDLDFLQQLRQAGVRGIYHVCRLREGTDTALRPEDRIQTMKNAKQAGLKVFTCCEPIGPEHTLDELVDNIFLSIELGLDIHAAMPRVPVPGSPMEHLGSISPERLSHIIACITLAFCSAGRPFMCVHEPLLQGLQAGANVVMAESGANPRDTEDDTTGHRGWSLPRCRKLLFDAGFDYLRRGDLQKVPLTREYLEQTNSFT